MKILLAACNAKYIHSNLAVYDLKAYSSDYDEHVILREYTINQPKDEILKDLYARQIRFGIDEAAIDAFLKNRTYCTDIVVARGKEPRHGENAWIEYFFETDLQAKPTRREDGSVDFFNLNTFSTS